MTAKIPSHYHLDRLYTGETLDTPEQFDAGDENEAYQTVDSKIQERELIFEQLLQHQGFDSFLEQTHQVLEQKRAYSIDEVTHDPTLTQSQLSPKKESPWFSWILSENMPFSLVGALSFCGVLLIFWSTPMEHKNHTHLIDKKDPNKTEKKLVDPPFFRKKGMLPKMSRTAKGSLDFSMLVFQKGTKNSRFYQLGEVLFPGDLIQFSYQSTNIFHVLILGINQKGEIYDVLSSRLKTSFLVAPNKARLPANRALELDDFLGQDCFVMIYAQQSFRLKEARLVLRKAFVAAKGQLANLHIRHPDWSFQHIVIHKRLRPKTIQKPTTNRMHGEP